MFRVFTYKDFGTLRVYIFDGRLWFVTADIVNLLGCEDTQKLSVEFVSYADKGITAKAPNNYLHIINECGAYSLICGVRNERSRAMLHWLVDDVIPELRKTAEPVVPAADVSAITAAPATEKYDFTHITNTIKQCFGEPKSYHYSNEYNMLNKIVIGMTAKEYRRIHDIPSRKSIRPYLKAHELKLLEMLEMVDIGLIVSNLSFNERKEKLAALANKYAP